MSCEAKKFFDNVMFCPKKLTNFILTLTSLMFNDIINVHYNTKH